MSADKYGKGHTCSGRRPERGGAVTAVVGMTIGAYLGNSATRDYVYPSQSQPQLNGLHLAETFLLQFGPVQAHKRNRYAHMYLIQ